MSVKRRYFDNAATSFPKPPGVSAAVSDYLDNIGASAGRGAYREAVHSRQILDDCRAVLRKLFSCQPADDVIFTLNGTDALNLAIKGFVKPGQHVVTTCMDHNSVLRPLNALQQRLGITWTAVAADPQTTLVDPQAVSAAFQKNTSLVAINHSSNVTGALQPIEPIVQICRERSLPVLLDCAQSAGHVPIDFTNLPIDMLACPGHKGLLGPLGTGILVLRAGFASRLDTLCEGGTGSESEHAIQPEMTPDKYEPGSHNAVGLAGLLAAVRWILERSVSELREHEKQLCARMIAGLDGVEGLRWFGPRQVDQRVGVFSIRLPGLEPSELSALLEERYGILTRGGLHCAPLAHQTIGTYATGGTTRLSLGPFLRLPDIDAAVDALAEITQNLPSEQSHCTGGVA
ncbi:MAG: aminotransferase class V-fold PLP-dependent enzyme [Planctomycetota bacterium]